MIRIRPTSISLSERDLDEHFRYIGRYQTLRAEGFKKEDVLKLYEEQQILLQGQENDEDHSFQSTQLYGSMDETQSSVESDEWTVGRARITREPHQTESLVLPLTATAHRPNSPPQLTFRHATARKSSLLRFAQNAESSSPEGASALNINAVDFPGPPSTRVRMYRARSQTLAWVQSEADDAVAVEDMPVDEFSWLSIQTPQLQPSSKSSPLRANARVFNPSTLPAPFASSIGASTHSGLPIRSRNTTPSSTANYEVHSRSTPNLPPGSSPEYETSARDTIAVNWVSSPPSTPPRRSSLGYQLRWSNPASPVSSIQLPEPPVTPARNNQFQTQPRTYHGHGGHSSLRIYDDSVSPSRQPQTPADLLRRPLLTDREAAFTAPPGSIGRTGHVVSGASPLRRAQEMRARWTREYRRARVVETEQLNGPRRERTLWREELAFDRVGEENSDNM